MKRKAQDDIGDGKGESSGGANDGNHKDPNGKRPSTEEEPSTIDDDAAAASPSHVSKRPTPKYGSKEYWEARYKSHLPDVDAIPENAPANAAPASENNNGNTDGEQNDCVLDGVVLSKEATKPGHEWYFSYDELRPLILPLILGNPDTEQDEESWAEEEEEEGEWTEEGQKEKGDDGSTAAENDNGENHIDKEESEVDEETADHTESSTNENAPEDSEEENDPADLLAGIDTTTHKPKLVLEVGCGDKPLGTSLASDLTSMQSVTGFGAQHVVKEVTCIDYSEIVVQSLIEEQKKEQEKEQSSESKDGESTDNLRATFQALDARSLPFPSNTYDIILEKGTLDAMLSDEEEGVSNCILIVKEMARVTSEGGAILIVSHLNASEPKGMGWLEDVVFQGLKDEFLERQQLKKDKKAVKGDETPKEGDDDDEKEYVWSVEVHGGDGKYLDANGDEIEDPDDDAIPIYGPAVYIVKKKSVPASIARELYGKKKKGTSAEEEEGDKSEGKEQDKDNIDEEGEMVEMPPVKLSYITYGDE